MPINISDRLPAAKILEEENIFFLREKQAAHQDIRPLEIVIMNLMPEKITTETQLLRLIGNTPIQMQITLLHPKTHNCKHTEKDHLVTFYKHFEDIKERKFDGLIITGAPVEHLEFEDVDYWRELTELMEWSKKNVTSTMYICWAAQAGLYYHYGIKKYPLEKKMFGIFPHTKSDNPTKLLRGFDDVFYVPHSRHTTVRKKDVKKIKTLELLSDSKEAGTYLIASKDGSQVFVTGHSEYDTLTLKREYFRDLSKGRPITLPKNYFKDNDSKKAPVATWRGHANLLFCNWINYYVYQEASFEL